MGRKFAIELIGAFFLVFAVGQCVILSGAGALAPVAIGASLMIMVYAGGHISGGHYNPAVSFAVFLRGKLPAIHFALYVIAQLIGALLAAAATTCLKDGATVLPLIIHGGPAMLAEFLFTFALVFVVLNVATVQSVSGNSYYGLAIGSTVMVGAFSVGSISGGAFNPAVALGITLLHISSASNLWILLLGEILGAAAAAGIFRGLNLGDDP
jgi:aquaporin Z